MTTVAEPTVLLSMVGTDLDPTEWVEVTGGRIDDFAEAVGGRSDLTEGYLALSMVNLFLPELLTVESFSMGVNVGLEGVRFPSPVPAGSRIRAQGRIVAASEEKGGVQVTVRVTVERDRGDGIAESEPACIADTVSRFFP